MCKSILITLLTWSTMSSFEVHRPHQAKELVPGEIAYTIGKFGHMLYGKTLIRKLKVPYPEDLCSPTKHYPNYSDSISTL
jgi:hypothetical protein